MHGAQYQGPVAVAVAERWLLNCAWCCPSLGFVGGEKWGSGKCNSSSDCVWLWCKIETWSTSFRL